jgi:hypothetical protein
MTATKPALPPFLKLPPSRLQQPHSRPNPPLINQPRGLVATARSAAVAIENAPNPPPKPLPNPLAKIQNPLRRPPPLPSAKQFPPPSNPKTSRPKDPAAVVADVAAAVATASNPILPNPVRTGPRPNPKPHNPPPHNLNLTPKNPC